MKPAYKIMIAGLIAWQSRAHMRDKSLGKTALGFVAAQIALRSFPAALFIGGGLAARKLHHLRKRKKAERIAEEPKALPPPERRRTDRRKA